jgi:small-conductance mechanosensitive channel
MPELRFAKYQGKDGVEGKVDPEGEDEHKDIFDELDAKELEELKVHDEQNTAKIGDLVEIEGVIGRVTSVGARCVVLTTRANVDVLVPNSKLMQNTLVNWTLSDNKVRYQVEVCIQRKSSINLNPTTLIPVFHQAMVNQEFVASEYDPEIFLIKIDENNFTFLLAFYCNLDDIHSPEYMQSTINISLFENLKGFQFSVDFPKLVDVKPTAEKADKA